MSLRTRAPRTAVALVLLFLLGGCSQPPEARRFEVSPSALQWAAPAGLTKTILLVGDSVPSRMSAYLQAAAKTQGWTVVNGAKGSCGAAANALVNPDGTAHRSDLDCTTVAAEQTSDISKYRPAIVLWWSRYEIHDRPVDGRAMSPSDAAFWPAARASLASAVDRLTVAGSRLVVLKIERSGIGMQTRCTPKKCHWFLKRLSEGQAATRWNSLLTDYASHDRRVLVGSVEPLLCNDEAVLCDDAIRDVGLARPDGTHISAQAAPLIAPQVIGMALSLASTGVAPTRSR